MNTEIRGPFDLRGGTERVRHRRTRLTHALARVAFAALADHARSLGVALRFEPLGAGRLRLEVEDELGILCVEGHAGALGADAAFVPTHLRWFRAGPTSAWARAKEVARRLGAPYRTEVGAFVLKRPLRQCVAHALLARGWRVPDDRSTALAIDLERDGFVLRAESADAPRRVDASISERAAAFASMLSDAPPPWLERALAPAVAPYSRGGDDEGSLVHRVAAEDARWLRADGVLLAAERAYDRGQDVADQEVLEALAVFPGDMNRQRDWGLRWAAAGSEAAIRLAELSLSGPWSRVSRAIFVADVALEFLAAAPSGPSEPHTRLRELLQRAMRDAPDSALVCAARGALLESESEDAEAIEAFVRAADLETDGVRAGGWRRRAGELCAASRGAAEARPMLEQAFVESKGDPLAIVALARVVAELGDEDRASELFGRLLRGGLGGGTHEDALVAAARFHVERGESDRAHPFMARLGPSLAPPPVTGFEDTSTVDIGSIEPKSLRGDEFDEPLAPGEFASGEIPLAGDESSIDDAFPSQIFERPDLEVTGVRKETRDSESRELDPKPRLEPLESAHPQDSPPDPPAAQMDAPGSPQSDAPQVTMIATTADAVRALLDDVRSSEEPEALLEGALEEAIEQSDERGVSDVLGVLDRIEGLRDEQRLRRRAETWRDQESE